jgi:hypothetical protein
MLKAILIIAVVGTASARIPVLGALAAILGVAGLELIVLAIRHGHAVWHYSAGFGLLVLVGEACFFAASWLLYDTAESYQRKALLDRFGRQRSEWPFI